MPIVRPRRAMGLLFGSSDTNCRELIEDIKTGSTNSLADCLRYGLTGRPSHPGSWRFSKSNGPGDLILQKSPVSGPLPTIDISHLRVGSFDEDELFESGQVDTQATLFAASHN